MGLFDRLSDYGKELLIKKGLKKSIRDSVNICLNANQGLGCLYYTVLSPDNDIGISVFGTAEEEYFAIINYDILKYSVVKDNLIVFQGDFRRDQDPVQVTVHDFMVYRSLTRAIELAALGRWFEFEDHVDRMWNDIMADITVMDIQFNVTAHELRLRVQT